MAANTAACSSTMIAPAPGASERPRRDTQADQLTRLLGLVFAGADLLLEVDARGVVTFALGAAEAITGEKEAALIGRNWTSLVAEGDGAVLTALIQGVAVGERRGPLRLNLAPNGPGAPTRKISISAFRMPGRGHGLSAAISLATLSSADFGHTEDGLLPAERFEAATASMLTQAAQVGQAVQLDLVELPGLRARNADLSPEASAVVRRKVAATLRADSYAGVGASEVAPDRFALIRAASGSAERLADQLKAATGGITPIIAALPTEGGVGGLDPRTVRFALDRFIAEGADAMNGGFREAVERTLRDTDRFRSVLQKGAFRLVYQPVVDLKDERLHHFEALSRFEGEASPAETIRMAEELSLMLDFDIAVARSVASELKAWPQASIAANLSAASLTNPRFTEALLAISDDRALRRRLLLEVTETCRLVDLEAASRSIDALRRAGFLVCLDDFGAGAASLDYLRALTVDFVKIDGRFIRDLAEDSREAVLLKHLVRLCEDLHVRTVAEVIETRAVANVARRLGVTFGQGYAFGRPTAEPVYDDPQPAAPMRRRGMVETWG